MGSFLAVGSVEVQHFSFKKPWLVLCEQFYVPSSSLSSLTISGGLSMRIQVPNFVYCTFCLLPPLLYSQSSEIRGVDHF